MKNLQSILSGLEVISQYGPKNPMISQVQFDSRKLEKDYLFVAVKGSNSNGHDFIPQAINAGVTAIIVEELPSQFNEQVCYLQVENSAKALSILSENWFDNPSKDLKLVGVTGTNGKTSVVSMCYNLFLNGGYPVGLLSTVENRINGKVIKASHTTPDPLQLSALLRKMVDAGCEYCFMEVSSHAMVQHRTHALDFNIGLFTNITHDHLDYHGDFKSYIAAKKSFFDGLKKSAVAIVNLDDKNAGVMLQNCNAKQHSYALQAASTFKGKLLENSFQGLQIEINGKQFHSRLVGKFNASNLTAVYAIASCLGIENGELIQQISALKSAEGRFEALMSDKEQVIGIIDYAHTPDALENVLNTINQLKKAGENLYVLVGCGGDRDKSKRPVMAKLASQQADKAILTSDNPRTEDPQAILDDMVQGLSEKDKQNSLVISNRKEAINTAVMMSQRQDIILIAGKGHEKYQEIDGVKHPFDDKEILLNAFKTHNK